MTDTAFSNGQKTDLAPVSTGSEQSRRKPPAFHAINREGTTIDVQVTPDQAKAGYLTAFGTLSEHFADHHLGTLINRATSTDAEGKVTVDTMRVNAMLALIAGTDPQNELEAALAVQIAISGDAAAVMLERTKPRQSIEAFNAYANFATKLARTQVAQIEALAKLKRGGSQNVEVRHVHVHEGGQAVVGVVNHTGVGQSDETAGRAHARTVSDAEMWSEDAVLSTVPVARREG